MLERSKIIVKTIKYLLLCCVLFITTTFIGCGDDALPEDKCDKKIEELFGCLNAQDADGLKSMFCEIIKNTENFDEQIQKALDFLEGEVISYRDSGGASSGYSRRWWKTTEFHYSAYIQDIETSSGKIYVIRFYGKLINNSNEDTIGLSELYIKDEKGDECIVGDYYLINPEKKR